MLIKFLKKCNRLTCALVLVIFIMIAFKASLFYSYVKLHQSHPLENIRAIVLEPVYAGQELIEFQGTFDRDVSCTLHNFRLDFTNLKTNDIIALTPAHLAKTPVPDKGPGKNLNIDFALVMPDTIYPGRWQPTFNGAYVCKYGIFTNFKRVRITVNSFLVIEKE
jgi:hypothetical protein